MNIINFGSSKFRSEVYYILTNIKEENYDVRSKDNFPENQKNFYNTLPQTLAYISNYKLNNNIKLERMKEKQELKKDETTKTETLLKDKRKKWGKIFKKKVSLKKNS